jgi:hypothetical protein
MGSAGGGSAPKASPYEKSLANLAKPWEQLAQGKGILAPAYQQVMNSFPSYGSVMADITESYRKAQQAAEGQSLIGNTLGRQQFAVDPRYASETAKGLANMQMTLPSQLAIQKATTQQALLNPQAAGQLLSQAGQMWGQRQQMGQANQQNMQGLIGQAAGAYAMLSNQPKTNVGNQFAPNSYGSNGWTTQMQPNVVQMNNPGFSFPSLPGVAPGVQGATAAPSYSKLPTDPWR